MRLLLFILALGLVGCPTSSVDTSWDASFDAMDSGWLLSVWGGAADDLYAVGGEPGRGRMTRFDGSGWTEQSLEPAVPLLNWVWGASATEVFVGGEGGTILHGSGSSFTVMPTPVNENIWGIWGSAADDVWAVGGDGFIDSEPFILHYDGVDWTLVDLMLPLTRAGVHAFFKVWGSAADDVYVVGQNGVLMHWDGVGPWQESGTGTGEDLIAIWGSDASHVLAVGGRGNGVVSRWDGSSWSTVNLSPMPGLNGVFMRNETTVHVVGVEGTLAVLDFETLEPRDDSVATRLDFHAIFGDSAGRLHAVGGNFTQPMGPFEGIAYTRQMSDDE